MTYADFLARRAQLANAGGFEPVDLPDHLFPFQRNLVEWAVRMGRGAIFADCGMGKTPMSLAWAEQVYRHTGRPVLLLTPLAVGFQVQAEAQRFSHDAALSRDGQITAPIAIANYERLHRFDPADFAGIVCDESSILKSFDGTTRAVVTEFARRIPYRLLGTATAAPNDWTELGTSSEALGGLGYMDMLTKFFTNKSRTATSRGPRKFVNGTSGQDKYRLKGHAEEPFWKWVSTWARAIRRPSDYGFDDGAFVLPDLVVEQTLVRANQPAEGALFDVPAVGLREEREEARRTLHERCEAAAASLENAETGVAWCHLNSESDLLVRLIPGAVQVSGSDSPEAKEEKLQAFTRGDIRALVTKPTIGAWGLNWQHSHRMTYFPSHSYEQWYQAVRRMWRFGQTEPVRVDVITTEGGQNVLANLQAKAHSADQMFSALVRHMNDAAGIAPHTYDKDVEVPAWLAS